MKNKHYVLHTKCANVVGVGFFFKNCKLIDLWSDLDLYNNQLPSLQCLNFHNEHKNEQTMVQCLL